MASASDTLRSLGLNDKECQVYLLLLQVGSAPASVIGLRAGMPKSTARYICHELNKKGLVSFSRKGDTYLYTPENPDRIVTRLEREKRRIEERQEAARRIVSELRAMMHPESMLPMVRFYEGIDGLVEAYDRILADVPAGGEILSYLRAMEPEEADRLVPSLNDVDVHEGFRRFIESRIDKGITTRVLALRSPQAEALQAQDAEHLRETRIVDCLPETTVPVEIILYGNNVCSVTASNGVLFASILENVAIAGMHRTMFELGWEAAGLRAAAAQ